MELARAAHVTESAVLAGQGVPVHDVNDGEIAGSPVRVYAPEAARGTIAYCTAAAG